MSIPIRSVLCSDEVDPLCVQLLQKNGISVTCKYKMPKEELLKEIQKHDGLVVRSDTKVTAEVLAAAPNLRVVGRAGTGVDNIDLEAATNRGVIVLNTPGGNSISACELTCALISSLARNVSAGCQSLKEGRWDRKLYSGSELQGKTLAVLGLGRIGREVATRMQAYGMKTVGFDPMVSKEDAAAFDVEKMELEQIWPIADYITVHTPLIPQTRHMINDKVFSQCKKGVRVVNVARGGIICEEGLLKALQDGRCGGAGLDVFSEEPPKSPMLRTLIEHPKVVATPHLGASTSEAQMRVAVEVAEQFVALANPASPYSVTGVVNAPVLGASLQAENTPWISLAQRLGVLAGRVLGGKLNGAKIDVTTVGAPLQKKSFLTTPVAAGIMSVSGATGVNLVNAPAMAKNTGVTINWSHDSSNTVTCVKVAAQGVVLIGTIGASGASVLLGVGDATFGDAGVPIDGNPMLMKAGDATNSVATIAAAASKAGVGILGLSVAAGSIVWVLLRTAQPINLVVPGVEVF